MVVNDGTIQVQRATGLCTASYRVGDVHALQAQVPAGGARALPLGHAGRRRHPLPGGGPLRSEHVCRHGRQIASGQIHGLAALHQHQQCANVVSCAASDLDVHARRLPPWRARSTPPTGSTPARSGPTSTLRSRSVSDLTWPHRLLYSRLSTDASMRRCGATCQRSSSMQRTTHSTLTAPPDANFTVVRTTLHCADS